MRPKFSVGVPAVSFPPWIHRRPSGNSGTPEVEGSDDLDEERRRWRIHESYYAGFAYDFYLEFGRRTNLDIQFVPVGGNPYSTAWQQVGRSALLAGRVNMTWSPEAQAPADMRSYSMYPNSARVLTRKTVRASGAMQIFAPFSLEVWVGILFAVFFGSAVMTAISFIHHYDWRKKGRGSTTRPHFLPEEHVGNTSRKTHKRRISSDSGRDSETDSRPPRSKAPPALLTIESPVAGIEREASFGDTKKKKDCSSTPDGASALHMNIKIDDHNWATVEEDADNNATGGTGAAAARVGPPLQTTETSNRNYSTQSEQRDQKSSLHPHQSDADEDGEEHNLNRAGILQFRFLSFLYHTLAAVLGGDEYDLYHLPVYGRVHRLGLLFLVLILTATYTANLAAVLTRPGFTVHGPQTAEEVRGANVCCRWPATEFFRYFFGFTGAILSPPASLMEFAARGDEEHVGGEMDLQHEYEALRVRIDNWAREQLFAGKCDAILEMDSFAHLESLEHCDSLHLHPSIRFGAWEATTLMPIEGTTLDWERAAVGADLGGNYRCDDSKAGTYDQPRPCLAGYHMFELRGGPAHYVQYGMERVRLSNAYSEMLQRNMRLGEVCDSDRAVSMAAARRGGGDGGENDGTITMTHVLVAFGVYGACSFLAILLTCFDRWRRESREGGDVPPPEAKGEVQNEKLDRKLILQNEKLNLVLARLTRLEEVKCESGWNIRNGKQKRNHENSSWPERAMENEQRRG